MNPESARAIKNTFESQNIRFKVENNDSPIISLTPAARIGGNQVIQHNQAFKDYIVSFDYLAIKF